MIAALQALRAQKIGDLVGAARQRRKRKLGLAVMAGIDDPERGAVATLGIARELGIEPVERPVEGNRIGPAEAFDRNVLIRAVSKQKGTRFLEGRHQAFPASPLRCWIIPEKSTPPWPAASNAL
jgi:hypothetical protein